MSLTTNEQAQLLETLAKLGGKANQEDDIVFEGRRLVVPETMTLKQASKFLAERIEEEERIQVFSRDFKYRPWDGAYCAIQALTKAFGAVASKTRVTESFFGTNEEPTQRITIQVGPNEQVEVPWGDFILPFMPEALITFDSTVHPEYGMVFRIIVKAPKKYRRQIEGMFLLVEQELADNSIYRGKAFDGQHMPEFLDLSGIDPNKVAYSEEVTTQLTANVWSVIRHSETHRTIGLPLKRAVLLAGPYGTGKSLAGALTAREATANGWTTILVRPGRDDFENAMKTARLYQPCVVFFEDAETIGSPESDDQVSKVLDLFDGITAKGTELMVVMTTNHPDKIHKGMMRPGRLDAVIHINALDRAGVERLVRAVLPSGTLAPDVDFDTVFEACTGYMPAFVKEACDRAVRYAVVRQNGSLEGMVIDTDDLVHAARGLRPQFEAMVDAPEHAVRDSLTQAFTRATQHAVAALAPDPDKRTVAESVWDIQALSSVQ